MSPTAKYLTETFITLFAVILVAVSVLYAAKRLGAGKPAGPIQLVGRLPLEGRRTLYLVQVGRSCLVLGGSEAGLVRLAEFPSHELTIQENSAGRPTFLDVFKGLKQRGSATELSAAEAQDELAASPTALKERAPAASVPPKPAI